MKKIPWVLIAFSIFFLMLAATLIGCAITGKQLSPVSGYRHYGDTLVWMFFIIMFQVKDFLNEKIKELDNEIKELDKELEKYDQ